jgi:DNA replication protein DnaC
MATEPIKELLNQKGLKNLNNMYYADEARAEGIIFNAPEPEPITCKYCGSVLRCKGMCLFGNKINIWLSHDRCTCEQAVIEYEQQKEEDAQAQAKQEEESRRAAYNSKIEKLLNQSRMGDRFKTRTFDNFIKSTDNTRAYNAALKYADKFDEYKKSGVGLIFSGTYGTGKTHLAAAITLSLINKGVPVVFGTLINLLGKIKESYNDNSIDEYDITQLYTTVDLLVIDDLGKEKPSEWVLEKLYAIINERYENFKPIIITTNYDHETLIKRLSVRDTSTAESIVSRLYEMCRGVIVSGDDYRRA